MKKLILSMLSVVFVSQAHGLTLSDCDKYSDEDIARILMDSIALGAQTGTSKTSCLATAKTLDVSIVGEELSEADQVFIRSSDDYRIVSIDAPSEQNLFRPVVHYKLRTIDGQNLSGEFAFKRHTNFLNPESINIRKCASITNEPSLFFILKACKN